MKLSAMVKPQKKNRASRLPGSRYWNAFLSLFLGLILFSCYKNKYRCYECEVLVLNPYEKKVFDRCSDKIDTVRYKDADGNDLPVSCTEK